jgi:molybdopterin-biosynthesis enzyme MoeA-like protein
VVSRAVHVVGLPEGLIAEPLGAVQSRYPDIDIGSYPFYRPTGNGVAIVAKGTVPSDADAAIAEVNAIIAGFGKVPVAGEPDS